MDGKKLVLPLKKEELKENVTDYKKDVQVDVKALAKTFKKIGGKKLKA